MGLVVTGIKCVTTCRRFLYQPLRVRLLELGPKSNEAIPKNSSQVFDKNQVLERIFITGIISQAHLS